MTRMMNCLAAVALGAVLAGCASTLVAPVSVTRFHGGTADWRAPGTTVAVAAAPAASPELSLYVAAVERALEGQGYVVAAPGQPAALTARVAMERFERSRSRPSPVSVGVGGSTGSYGSGLGLGLSFNLGGGPRAMTDLRLMVRLDPVGGDAAVWEGRAETSVASASPAAQPGLAAAKLAAALFQDFPGGSGQTIEVR